MTIPNEAGDASLVLIPPPRGHLVRLMLALSLASFWPLSAILFIFPLVSPAPLSRVVAARCWDGAFSLLIAGPLPAVLMLMTTIRGCWRIDPEGVEYRSPRGTVNVLRWTDIEYVRFDLEYARPGYWKDVVVRGDGRSIHLPLRAFPELERGEAVRLLKRFLPDFDLTDRPRARPARKSTWTIVLGPGTIIAVGITALLWAALSYLRSPIPRPFIILVGCWIWFLLGGIGWGGRFHRLRHAGWRSKAKN